ncbi:MAG: hypothetical protein F6K16_37585 [Symploca sp. SIO2B6]|nr:hypothetical protein [Symploca sp. SIO2B6]
MVLHPTVRSPQIQSFKDRFKRLEGALSTPSNNVIEEKNTGYYLKINELTQGINQLDVE